MKKHGYKGKILNKINKNAIVIDTGSIKFNICNSLKDHPMRENFVASHPIAGTEYSGPEAAFESLFEGKKNIICDPESTRVDLLNKALDILFFDAESSGAWIY